MSNNNSKIIIKLCTIGMIKKIYVIFTYICSIIPSNQYLKITYRIRTGKKLNLKNPKTFNEKLVWLKLNKINYNYTNLVDKVKVREYIKNTIGEQYLIPLIGVYNSPDDINTEELPDRFVIKCTHDSGSVVVCKNKNDFNKHAKNKLKYALKRNYYYAGREYPYKNASRRLIVEEYMEDADSNVGIIDYKFYCFNGEPKYLYVSAGLDNHSTAKISFYNIDLTPAPFQRMDYNHFDKIPKTPTLYKEMVEIARKLSKDTIFVRVDLYEINKKIYFSELTFFPAGCTMPFDPPEYDAIIGNELII